MKPDFHKTFGIILVLSFACGTFQHSVWAADERETLRNLSKAFSEIAKEAGQMVVSIQTERAERHSNRRGRFEFHGERPEDWERLPRDLRRWFRRGEDGEYHFFFRTPESERERRQDDAPRERRSLRDARGSAAFGSGILIDDQGHIATIIDVVRNSEAIYVMFQDGTRVDAETVGVDTETGVGIIKVDLEALSAARLGDSDTVSIGELALAVWNTADAEPAVSLGVINGLGRNPKAFDYENWIGIDANLPPGSGGGAVIDAKGEVIGMIVADASDAGFAIPINVVQHIAAELIEHGEVARGWLGVSIQDVNPELADKLDLDTPMGALITGVGEDSPADASGLQRGDVIVAVDGKPIKHSNHLRHVIAFYAPGSTASVTVVREGKKSEVPVTLGERSDRAIRSLSRDAEDRRGADWKGLNLQNLNADVAEKLGYTAEEGVLIAGVEPNSSAAEAGLRRGDVIIEVENQPVHSVDEFKSAVKKVEEDKTLLQVKRDGRLLFVVVD